MKKKIIFIVLFVALLTLSSNCLKSVNYHLKNKKMVDWLLAGTNSFNDNHKTSIKSYINNYLFKPRHLLNSNYIELVSYQDKRNTKEVSVLRRDELPTVYIYNTHQKEEYKSNNLELYNIKPTVLTADYILKENLYKAGIYSIVEETNIQEILNINKWAYAKSYIVSRSLMEDAIIKYPTLDYFIDIHRDSVPKNISTTTIANVSYARILFVLGLENENYHSNLKLMEDLNKMFNEKYPGLSRGIYKKEGPNVNGIYNQDFSAKCILLEVGGEENTIEEVNNTINAVSDILMRYMGGTING